LLNFRWLPSYRALPGGLNGLTGSSIRLSPVTDPGDPAEPCEKPADSLEESASASFSGFSGPIFIEFHSDLDGCRGMKTRDGGYMHVISSPVAGGKLPQALVARGQL